MDGDDLLGLRVTRAEIVADGIMLIEMRDPAGATLPPWTPGAHLAVRVPTGAMRTYSLCGDPAQTGHYAIAVKRDAAGRGGSVSLVDRVAVGDTLHVSAPANLFGLQPAPGYIFVAGGIGITPILAMIHAVRGRVPFHVYYLTRTAAHAAFLPELAAPDLAGHITIHHDGGVPGNAFDLWPVFEQPTRAHVYCCGPRPLMDAVQDMTGHWPGGAVHFEDFGADLARPRPDDAPFTVRLARSGMELAVPPGITVLDAMRAHGLHVPSSCESGTCGTCRTAVLEGEVDHRDRVLSAPERVGAMMVCVSRAKGGLLVLDA